MSPARQKSDAKHISGISEGDFYNSVLSVNYGNSVQIVPLLFFKSRVRFKPMTEGGGMLCSSADSITGVGDPGGECAVCPMSQFHGENHPECALNHNYIVLVKSNGKLTLDGLAVLSLKSSALKTARDFNALLRLRNVDSFAGIYHLSSSEKKNDVGTWYIPVIKPAGWVSQSDYELAKSCYEGVREMQKAGKLRVDADDLGSERQPGDE
jgi:hypothetical protein